MRKLKYIFWTILAALSVISTACIEDGFTTSSSDLLTFSTDTLAFDTIFTAVGTPTKQFIVYNRHDKMINISSIKMAGESNGKFYLNVDGVKGSEFNNVEIRGNDSIFVFVEAFIDPTDTDNPIEFKDKLDFETNGVKQQVVITAWGQDVKRLTAPRISEDTHFTAERPYVIFDTLRVEKGASLTIDAGATLFFHDKAAMVVDGTLIADGSQDKPINLRGDRLDKVVGGIGYDIMSGQWGGIKFSDSSFGNEMNYVYMRGSSTGVVADSSNVEKRKLHLFNTVLHNASGSVLTASHSWVEAEGCEFSDAGNSVVDFTGGTIRLINCTLANYYLFSVIRGSILHLSYVDYDESDGVNQLMDARFDNCIIYGNSSDLNMGDFTGMNVYFRNCLLKSKGSDDDNFLSCVWGGDPKFYTVREKYVFDYRLKNESEAVGAGNSSLCPQSARLDRYGVSRINADGGIDIGAYAWVEGKEDDDNK